MSAGLVLLFQVVKFSPDGRLLAIGSRDNNIYIYQVSEDYRKYNRIGRCMVSIFASRLFDER